MSTVWIAPELSPDRLRDILVRALSLSRLCVTVQEPDGRYVAIVNLPDCWKPEGDVRSDTAIFGDTAAADLATIKDRVIESGETVSTEIATDDGRVFEFVIECASGSLGSYLVSTITDLTSERRREKALRVLLREVSHRSKNLLAIIQSIANQTARRTDGKDDFLMAFRGRLYSLAQSQDLITDSNWRGAHFRELLNNQIGQYLPDKASGVVTKGIDPILDPNAALHIGLALHELAVNAVSRHATKDTVHVIIECKPLLREGKPYFQILWEEEVGPDEESDGQANDDEESFASMVLNQVVPAAVDGQAELSVEGGTLTYELVFPEVA